VSTVSTELSPQGGADAELPPGSPVGEYTIDAVLGRGGFGTVYRGIHPLIGKQVAIKVLARKYASDPDVISRFAAEARAVNQIRHRNIIDIFQFSTLPDGRHYYVMECLDGEPLDQYLTRHGPLALAEALPILRAIGRALDAAHAKGIAHRDLKPENIFLARDADGERFPKLLDFGIAKLFGSGADSALHRTATGVPIGTPYYMSPEQCRGKDVDQRTDVYSFGIVAYRMLTNTYPFDGADYVELLFQQVNEEPPPPSSRNPALPAAVDAAIAWMMRKDRDQRPATLHEALAAFDDVGEAGARPAITPNAFAQTAASVARPSKKPSRKPAVWIGATLVLVCSAAGMMLVMKKSPDPVEVASSPHDDRPVKPNFAISPPVTATDAAVGETVKLTLAHLPPHARVTYDGIVQVVTNGAIVVAKTTEPKIMLIEVPGYATQHYGVPADRDRTIEASPFTRASVPRDPLATPDSHGIEVPNFKHGAR
jgi:serine/threonine protein kinase